MGEKFCRNVISDFSKRNALNEVQEHFKILLILTQISVLWKLSSPLQ